jgi:phosphoglycolate phosphatase
LLPKLLIFDFDGTLADTFSLSLEIFDGAARKFRFRPLDRENLTLLRGMTARQIFEHHGVPLYKLPLLARYMRASMQNYMHEISIFDGVDTMLRELSEKQAVLTVLSSNASAVVEHVLSFTHVGRFRHIECGSSLFGKASRIRRILDITGIAASDALLIGDEIRDIEAARQVKIPFGAVAWGYTRLDVLLQQNVQHVFLSPEAVASELYGG